MLSSYADPVLPVNRRSYKSTAILRHNISSIKTYTVNQFLPWQLMVVELLMLPQHKGIDYPMSENGSTVFRYFWIQLGIKGTNLKRTKKKNEYITMLS